jgi:hypothetical protein
MYFVEGLGSPFIESTLCPAIVGLAQSKGLHRRMPVSCGLSEAHVSHRAWIFWAIYCFEKHSMVRSDRPSVG